MRAALVRRRSLRGTRSDEREDLVLAALDALDRAVVVTLEREHPGRLRLAAFIVKCAALLLQLAAEKARLC